MIFNYIIDPVTQQYNPEQLRLALLAASFDFVSLATAGDLLTIQLVDGSVFDPTATIKAHCSVNWNLVTLIDSKKGDLEAAYNDAITRSVSFTTTGGVTSDFQADAASQQDLANMILAFGKDGVTPIGFYWVAADNTRVPFTYADLQGLAAAMGAQGWAAFQHLQAEKAAVIAATTAEAVAAVAWQ